MSTINIKGFIKKSGSQNIKDLEFAEDKGPILQDKADSKKYRLIVTSGVLSLEEVTE